MVDSLCKICGFACLLVCTIGAHVPEANGFDFVIVGGGLAGSVLANRLSASGEHSVLLMNVAGEPAKAYSGPVVLADEFIIHKNLSASGGLSAHIHQPGYSPVPDFSTDETGSSPARMLGGSSLVALSLYLRDHPEALNEWGVGWSWDDLRPYFHRAEGLQATDRALAESDYGREGPYTVQELPAYTHPFTQEFIRASRKQGLPWAPDLNTDRGTGVGLTPTTQNADGSKVHAFDAYLAPALGRHNLRVMHGVRVDRLLIDDDICRGVVYRHLADGNDYIVRADREVILSSGYIYTPRVLFLSGIGAKEDLEAVGLKVVKNLPAVGRNLTAARFSPLAYRTFEPSLSHMMGAPISPDGLQANPSCYASAVLEATARSRSSVATQKDPNSTKPDIVLSFMPLFYSPMSAPLQYSLQGESWPLQTNGFTILATLGETKAQGSVTFRSGSPDVSPTITHDAMTDPEDLARAQEAVALAKRIVDGVALADRLEAIENGAGAEDMWSAVYDGRGTCRMGKTERDSVVDLQLRVHGVGKLRIVDGSVIPVGSPYLAVPEVLALAERASELVLGHKINPSNTVAETATVSVRDLAELLGEHFPIMEGVAYLAGMDHAMPTESLLSTPPMFAPGSSLGTWTAVAVLSSLLVSVSFLAFNGAKSRVHSSDKYSVMEGA